MASSGVNEEIFESEANIPNLPEYASNVSVPQSEDIDCGSIDAVEAFTIFNGKLYSTSQNYSIADSIERRAETPMQRFTRLRAELSELHEDMTAMATQKKADSAGASIWSVLQVETERAVEELKSLKENSNLDEAFRVDTINGDEMNNLMEQLNVKTEDGDSKTKANSRDMNMSRGLKADIDEMKAASSLAAFEKRLFSLETLLGAASNAIDIESAITGDYDNNKRISIFPLVEAVARMEKKVDALDEKTLESIRIKAATVRTELEAMNREKSRGATATEQKAIDAAARINDLIERSKRVDAVASDLPSLLLRLKTLEKTHLAATTFAQRVDHMEVTVQEAQEQLMENREILNKLNDSLTSSLSIFKDNIDRIDARMAALSKK